MKANFDYSKTMMMKIQLGLPDHKGGCNVRYTFEQALDLIKNIDATTMGAPKIIYLVGWQYLGHDDKYPAFFEANEHLKRDCDVSARDSLLWLINEAKNYNTTVSLHINLSDAYPDSPLWQEYIDNDLILKDNSGNLKVTGCWNNEKAYQIRFAKEFESGFFQKRVDKLFEILPIKEMKTIHVDAFFVRKGKDTTIAEEKIARRKMVEYFNAKGVDITSEFIYRETSSGGRPHFGKSDTIGLIPAYWNIVMSPKDLISYQAESVAGGVQCGSLALYKKDEIDEKVQGNGLTLDSNLHWLFYGNIHGEETFSSATTKSWQNPFARAFFTYNLPYFYINHQKRVAVKGLFNSRKCHYTGDITTYIKNHKITCGDNVVKFDNDVCLPAYWLKNTYLAYSENGGSIHCYTCDGVAKVYEITNGVKTFINDIHVTNGCFVLKANPNSAYAIIFE